MDLQVVYSYSDRYNRERAWVTLLFKGVVALRKMKGIEGGANNLGINLLMPAIYFIPILRTGGEMGLNISVVVG